MCHHCLLVRFPGVVGCVNGSHITILKPTHNGETFFNRKKDYSINCMFVCNSQEIILYSIGSPGSYHDNWVFRRSRIQDLLDRQPSDRHLLGMKLLFPAPSLSCCTKALCYQYHHVVGDSAYPQSMSLMKPYPV